MIHFASDLAINTVKALVDNCRCVNCDHLNQVRYRFSCGHSVCEVCIETTNNCVLCSPTSSNASPVIDKPQTNRVQHVSELLNNFQSFFNVDVYRKQRNSEILKAEREIFPTCIQAPIKYHNKRKSSTSKENIEQSFLPGESINAYESVRMEKSKNYVKQWLNQNENNFFKEKQPRTPFADLSTNTVNSNNLLKTNRDHVVSRKRKMNKSAHTTRTFYNPQCKKSKGFGVQKCQNHESGIELEDDVCFINDSQSVVLDKDELAQIAVLEADKKFNSFTTESLCVSKDLMNKIEAKDSLNLRKEHIENVPITSKSISTSPYKVPFYKKSILFDACKLCAKFTDENVTNIIKMKNVTIVIDNPSFLTTVQISEDTKPVPKFKSIATQTERVEIHLEKPTDMEAEENVNKLINERPVKCQILNKESIVIEDSDCDSSDNEASAEIEVKADIHRACKYEDYIFKQLQSYEYENRIIPRVRGNTPASSDSSDKENYNPNRKKQKLTSKSKKKGLRG